MKPDPIFRIGDKVKYRAGDYDTKKGEDSEWYIVKIDDAIEIRSFSYDDTYQYGVSSVAGGELVGYFLQRNLVLVERANEEA